MFNTYAHTYIDFIQNSKKEFVKHAVKHDRLADIYNNFIDSQTKYTKSAVDAGIDVATAMSMLLVNKDFYNYNWFTSAAKK